MSDDIFTTPGRAFPGIIDGTPQNYNEREKMHANDEDEDDDEAAKSLPRPVPGEELDAAINQAATDIIELKAQRKKINAEMQEVYSFMETRGIPRAALRSSINQLELTDEQRESHDRGVSLTRKALRIPYQTELDLRQLQ